MMRESKRVTALVSTLQTTTLMVGDQFTGVSGTDFCASQFQITDQLGLVILQLLAGDTPIAGLPMTIQRTTIMRLRIEATSETGKTTSAAADAAIDGAVNRRPIRPRRNKVALPEEWETKKELGFRRWATPKPLAEEKVAAADPISRSRSNHVSVALVAVGSVMVMGWLFVFGKLQEAPQMAERGGGGGGRRRGEEESQALALLL